MALNNLTVRIGIAIPVAELVISGADSITQPGQNFNQTLGWNFLSTGVLEKSPLYPDTNWLNTAPNPILNYWIKWTNPTGDAITHDTINVWHSLSTNRSAQTIDDEIFDGSITYSINNQPNDTNILKTATLTIFVDTR